MKLCPPPAHRAALSRRVPMASLVLKAKLAMLEPRVTLAPPAPLAPLVLLALP